MCSKSHSLDESAFFAASLELKMVHFTEKSFQRKILTDSLLTKMSVGRITI
jgi:hypothetical protein